jgi:pantothenate kinase-related protein Tda10
MTTIDPGWLAAFLRDEGLAAEFAEEIERLHAPLAARIAAVALGPAFVVGICGPQGSGKTTTVRVVAALLEARGLKVATLSLDDLYLPLADREALAATFIRFCGRAAFRGRTMSPLVWRCWIAWRGRASRRCHASTRPRTTARLSTSGRSSQVRSM